MYLRETFFPKSFYHIPGIAPDTYIYVLDNRTLAGREPRDALDAQSKPLVLAFFERVSALHEELIVERVDKTFNGMTTKTLTVAELMLHLGYNLPPDPERSVSAAEQIIEDMCFNVQRFHVAAEILDNADEIHTYKLTDPYDAEDVFFDNKRPHEHTKIALSRHLEREHGWRRARLWALNQGPLLAARASGDCPPGCAGPG